MSRQEDAELYLAEARNVASLDHPHIVPVYDVGGTDYYPCFVVSKFIDGQTPAARHPRGRCTWRQASELVETVAEALHHAHKQGLVHRRAGNILLDPTGKPFVVDFGLALREQDVEGPTPTQTHGKKLLTGRVPNSGSMRNPGTAGTSRREHASPQGSTLCRHAALHEPRAGLGRGAPGRRPVRRLQPGSGLLRAADRLAPILGRDPGER